MSDQIRAKKADFLVAKQTRKELNGKVRLSPVLARLIEEVRYEQIEGANAYNRTHNRHNRSR